MRSNRRNRPQWMIERLRGNVTTFRSRNLQSLQSFVIFLSTHSAINSSTKRDNANEKPPYSYVALIAMAIQVNNLNHHMPSLRFYFLKLFSSHYFYSIRHCIVPHWVRFTHISHRTIHTTRRTRKAGKIPFATISVWTSASWKLHATEVAKERETIGHWVSWIAVDSKLHTISFQRFISTEFRLFVKIDPQYGDMFENGNFRRRRRMKRPYRTGAHFSKVFDPYASTASYGITAGTRACTMFPNNSFAPYQRYDAQ